MDFNQSDFQRMLLESAERYIADRFTLEHRRASRSKLTGLDEEAWANFAQLGWLALAIPEQLGGLGGAPADVAVLCAALGNKCVTQPFISTAVLGVYLLANAQPAREAELAELAAGAVRLALAHCEPGERYPELGGRTSKLSVVGDGYSLSGDKMMVLDAPSATHLIVSASLPGGEPALILVCSDQQGIVIDSYPLLDDSRAADISFTEVKVDSSAILASGANASRVLAQALELAMVAGYAQAVGSMEEVLRICSYYLKERQQFGQPIGKFQSLQHIMADMFVAAHQSRSALYQALANLEADAPDRERAVSLAGLTIGEAGQVVSRQGVQLHGGYGVTDEYEVSHHYRYQLVLEKRYADLDLHALRVSGG